MARGFPERSKRVRLVFDADVWVEEREAVVAELLLVGVDWCDRASELIDEVTEAVSEELNSGRVVILTPRPSLLRTVSRCDCYVSVLAGLIHTCLPAQPSSALHL